jgi:Na+-transporting methylmalonyl-CoA/oxaloacetate decarboxylase gamma subunit
MIETFWIAMLGMAVVFLVLGINYGLILLIGMLHPKEVMPPTEVLSLPSGENDTEVAQSDATVVEERDQPERESAIKGEGIDPRILAAIGAALRAYERDEMIAPRN